MAYSRPESNLRAEWCRGHTGVTLYLSHRGREYERKVSLGDVVSVIEAAAIADVSRMTVYHWINQGWLAAEQGFSAEGEETTVIRLLDLREPPREGGRL